MQRTLAERQHEQERDRGRDRSARNCRAGGARRSVEAVAERGVLPARREAAAFAKKAGELNNKLRGLKSTVATLESHFAEESAAQAVAEIKRQTKQARALTSESDECWSEAGETLKSLLGVWNRYAEVLQQRAEQASDVESSKALRQARTLNPEIAAAWGAAPAPAEGDRIPLDFGAFVEMLIEIGLDPRREGNRPETTEIITRNAEASMRPTGEPEQTRTVVTSGNRKYPPHLAELLPDCRGKDRRVQLSAAFGSGVSTFGSTQTTPGESFSVR
jgi:hypothetical protein